jgi:glycosyltransferase involved in cell wall biosynthesis
MSKNMIRSMSDKNPKILYLSKGGLIAGAQRQLLYLLRGLDRTRFTPLVLCTQEGPFLEELQNLGIRCIARKLVGWRKFTHLLARCRDVAYLRRLVRAEGVALVHSSDIWLSEYMLRGAASAGVPSVLHIRAPVDRRTLRNHHCAKATALVAISKRVQMRLSRTPGVPREKVVLIHDAVDQNLFLPRDRCLHPDVLRKQYHTAGKIQVGLVGRIEKSKEQLAFARIAREVLGRTDKAVFFLIGETKDASYYRQIVRYLRENHLLDRVHFTGRREDIADVLADLDILVSLSGGSVRYEAMMCGVAVLCAWSRSPEESHHVRHNETGFLVPPREIGPVVDVLVDAIEHDELRERIGRTAQAWAQQNLTHAALVEDTQNLYDRLLGNSAV